MTPEIKKLIKPLSLLLCAVLFFIFMAMSFIDFSMAGVSESVANGYDCLNPFDAQFTADSLSSTFLYTIAGFLVILMLIAAILMAITGLLSLLGKDVPALTKYADIVFLGYTVASILSFLCLLIYGFGNTESEEIFGETISAGLGVGIGAILLLIFTVLIYVANILVARIATAPARTEEDATEKESPEE